MTFANFILLVAGSLALLYAILLVIRGVHGYLTDRARNLVSCPETQQTAAVGLEAGQAVREVVTGKRNLKINECSRWPEKKGCAQKCLSQIEETPSGCLIQAIVNEWYEGK